MSQNFSSSEFPSAPQNFPQGQGYEQASAVSLDQPLYGASFGQAVSRFFKKIFVFQGRASRSEYWWVFLLSFLVSLVAGIVLGFIGSVGMQVSSSGEIQPGPLAGVTNIIYYLISLAITVAMIGLSVRRLHDANFSGFWALLMLILFFGWIALLVMFIMPSKPEGARFDAPGAAQ